MIHGTVWRAFRETHTGVFLERISFVPDESSPQVQAADLLMYEWRKRITDHRVNPAKERRLWFDRMRGPARRALWRYGDEVFVEALKAEDQLPKTWAHAVMHGSPSHRD